SKRSSPTCIQAPSARTAGSSSTANRIASAAVAKRRYFSGCRGPPLRFPMNSSAGVPQSDVPGPRSIQLPPPVLAHVSHEALVHAHRFLMPIEFPLSCVDPCTTVPAPRDAAFDPIRGVQGHFDVQPSLVRDGG